MKLIEEFYASHIKNMVDASVINVWRPKVKPRPRKEGRAGKRVQNLKIQMPDAFPLAVNGLIGRLNV